MLHTRKPGLSHGDAAGAGEPVEHTTVGVRKTRVGNEQRARAPSQDTITPVPESGYVPVEAGNDDVLDEPVSMLG